MRQVYAYQTFIAKNATMHTHYERRAANDPKPKRV